MSRLHELATRALEALELGDVRGCESILLSALEDAPGRGGCTCAACMRKKKGLSCPVCGLACSHDGRLADHLRVVHRVDTDADEAVDVAA